MVDARLMVSLLIKRNEGPQAWHDWRRFQMVEPVENEVEIGIELSDYFLDNGEGNE